MSAELVATPLARGTRAVTTTPGGAHVLRAAAALTTLMRRHSNVSRMGTLPLSREKLAQQLGVVPQQFKVSKVRTLPVSWEKLPQQLEVVTQPFKVSKVRNGRTFPKSAQSGVSFPRGKKRTRRNLGLR